MDTTTNRIDVEIKRDEPILSYPKEIQVAIGVLWQNALRELGFKKEKLTKMYFYGIRGNVGEIEPFVDYSSCEDYNLHVV